MSEKSDASIEIEIDQNDTNIDEPHNDNDKPPHNGKSITKVEVSPSEKYLVTYSQDDRSIIGWNVEDVNEGQLKPEFSLEIYDISDKESQICVSDDKKFAYINYDNRLGIYDMNRQKIELDVDHYSHYDYCIFNSVDELILFGTYKHYDKIIWIYSTQTKNNKWKCKRIYEIPHTFKFISISKYDKFYFYSNKFIYEWDLLTGKSIKIFGSKEIKYDDGLKYEYENDFVKVEMFNNEKYIFIKFNDKIVIYPIELEVPFSLNDIQLNDFMCRTGLIRLLLNESEIKNFMIHCWKECLNRLKKNVKLSKEYQTTHPDYLLEYDSYFHVTTKYAFGVLNGYICKIKLEEEITKMNFSLKNSDIIIDDCEDWYFDNDFNKETYVTLKIHKYPYMDTIRALFQEVMSDYTREDEERVLTQNLIKWKIKIGRISYRNYEIELQVFKKINDNSEWNLICRTSKNYSFYNNFYLCGVELFNDNEIIILTTQALFIYYFNENLKSISLNYYYDMYINPLEKRIDKLRDHEKVFSKPTLPLPNFNKYLLASLKKDNEECFLKHGVELLLYAIKEYESRQYYIDEVERPNSVFINDICIICINYDNKEMLLKYVVELYSLLIKERSKYKDKDEKIANLKLLICDIYKRCISYDNKEILLKYGVKLLTFVIEERQSDLIDEIYKKCIKYFREDPENNRMFLSIIVSTMPLLSEYYPEYISRYSLETTMIIDFPFYSIRHLNDNLHLHSLQYPQIVNSFKFTLSFSLLMNKYRNYYPIITRILIIILVLISLPLIITFAILVLVILVFYIYYFEKFITTTTITFMIPYIKFVNYPKDYKWYLELMKPQPSVFVKIISKDIYKTWDGEALINFKWNTYGKYYYAMIWIGFMALLGCFTTAATIPKQYIDENIQKQLLIASIILGFVHLGFEVRQMIYDFNKWILDFWNIFDIIAFSLPIITSILWLQTNNINNHILQLLSFSCLFLDIKFLLFFRAFESFGIYFAIIISVAKQIIYFLVVLLIIIISFAHAFYILLLPRSNFSFDQYTNNTDPNNPWNIVNTYNQIFNNGTIIDSFFIQKPDGNTNMFVDFRTALFGMYLFLTGDSSALSNWSYTDNPSLAILVVLFSLLIVVYLMNLFIGLLNMAIDKDNDRVSYLMLKAQILAEIELFYLLPYQRRWPAWFPDVIYYYADEDKTRKKIKEMMDNGEWNTDGLPEIKQNLLDILNFQYIKHNPINEITLQKILENHFRNL